MQNRFTLRHSYVLKPKSKGWATLTTAKPSNLKDTLNVTNEELYPSISTVLLILYIMPASTATTGRSFAVLRRLEDNNAAGLPDFFSCTACAQRH